ncbi:MAG: DUF3987 domain-containing protein [Deltaproteobacteria bacterium]|jgi:hypothetical protein|nr:DUF3987 domain-containing protein [Deltaproteobacteria bacterium]
MRCPAIISVAMNGKYYVDLGEHWNEAIVLYQLFIAPSGSKKSAFIDLHKKPLFQMSKRFQSSYDNDASLSPALARERINVLKQSKGIQFKELDKTCRFPSGNPDYNSL